MNTPTPVPPTKPADDLPPPNLFLLSGEIGLIIVIPLLVAVIIGVKLDRWLGTLPLFTIIGMFLASIISGISLWRKISRLNKNI